VELARLAALGVRQITLHPNSQELDVADTTVARITAKCGELGLVVLFDSYNPMDPGQIGKLLALSMRQPKTRFVWAHMGCGGMRELLALAVLRRLDAPRNVWVDLSAIGTAFVDSPLEAELVWAMRQIGMDRVLFGSDWPIDAPAVAVRAVQRLGLTREEERQVLCTNATALLALPDAP
jgi:uncharacterized protein